MSEGNTPKCWEVLPYSCANTHCWNSAISPSLQPLPPISGCQGSYNFLRPFSDHILPWTPWSFHQVLPWQHSYIFHAPLATDNLTIFPEFQSFAVTISLCCVTPTLSATSLHPSILCFSILTTQLSLHVLLCLISSKHPPWKQGLYTCIHWGKEQKSHRKYRKQHATNPPAAFALPVTVAQHFIQYWQCAG